MEKTTTPPVPDLATAITLVLTLQAGKAVQMLIPLSQHPTFAKDFMAALAKYKPEQLNRIQTRLLEAIDAVAAHCPPALASVVLSINPGNLTGAERLRALRGRIPANAQALCVMPVMLDAIISMQPTVLDPEWFRALSSTIQQWNPVPASVHRVFDTLGKAAQAQRPHCYAEFANGLSSVLSGAQWTIVIQEVLKDDARGDSPAIKLMISCSLNRPEVCRLLNVATKKALLQYLIGSAKLHDDLIGLLRSPAKWDFLDLLYPLSTAAVPLERCFAVKGFTRALMKMLLEVHDQAISNENPIIDVIQFLYLLRRCPGHVVGEIACALFDVRHAVPNNWSMLISLALDVGDGALDEHAFTSLVFGAMSLGAMEATELTNVCKALIARQTDPMARVTVLLKIAEDCAEAAAARGETVSGHVPDWVWAGLLKDFAAALKQAAFGQFAKLEQVVAIAFGAAPGRPPLPAARQQEVVQVIIAAGKVNEVLGPLTSDVPALRNGLFKLLFLAQPQAAGQIEELHLLQCFGMLAAREPALLCQLQSLDHILPAERQLGFVAQILVESCHPSYAHEGIWKFVHGLQLPPPYQLIKRIAVQLSMREGKLGNWYAGELDPQLTLPAESEFVPASWLECLSMALRDPKRLKDANRPKLVAVCKNAILNAMANGHLDWAVVKEVSDFHHALATQHPQIDWKTVHQGDPFALLKPSAWKPVHNALLAWLDGVREAALVYIDALQGPQDDSTKKIAAMFEPHFHGLAMLITGGKNAAINAWKPADQGGRQHLFDLAFGGPTGQLVIDLTLLEAIFHGEPKKPLTVTPAASEHIAALLGSPLASLAQKAALHRLRSAHDALVAVVATKAFPTQRDALRMRLQAPRVNTSPLLEASVLPWFDAIYECLIAVFNAEAHGKRNDKAETYFKQSLRALLMFLCPSHKAFIEKWNPGPDGSWRPLVVLMLGAYDALDASMLRTIFHWQGPNPLEIDPSVEAVVRDLFLLPAVTLGPIVDAAQKKLNTCHLALQKFVAANKASLAHQCADFVMRDVTIIGKFGALATKPWHLPESVQWMIGPTVLVGVTTPEGELLAWAWCALLQVPNQPGITLSVEDIHIDHRKWRLSTVWDVTPAGKRVLDVLIAAIPGIARRLGATNAILCNTAYSFSEAKKSWARSRNRPVTHLIPAQQQILPPLFLGEGMRPNDFGERDKYDPLD